jgi:hypothetical protein
MNYTSRGVTISPEAQEGSVEVDGKRIGMAGDIDDAARCDQRRLKNTSILTL